MNNLDKTQELAARLIKQLAEQCAYRRLLYLRNLILDELELIASAHIPRAPGEK